MHLSKRLFLLLLWLPLGALHAQQAAPISAPIEYTVAEILNGKSFNVTSVNGTQTVRMASLQVPNVEEKTGKKRAGDPLGEESKAQLVSLLSGKIVKLATSKNPYDRKGRIVAQVYLKDGTWVQEAMLKSGFAMVYPIFEDSKKSDLGKMLAAENEARTAKKGIWEHPNYQVLDVDKTGCCLDQFRLVRGTVLAVEARRGNIFINYGKDWNSDFTVFIPKRYARSFADVGIENLAGKPIEVRGWIEEKGGPMIELMRPEQLKVIPY
jgi:endonuclease YncB( thermonuclease family)